MRGSAGPATPGPAGAAATPLAAAAAAALAWCVAAGPACSPGDRGGASAPDGERPRAAPSARAAPPPRAAAGEGAVLDALGEPGGELRPGDAPGRDRVELEREMRRALDRRDELLARLRARDRARWPVGDVSRAWGRGRARVELEEVVAQLQRLQARLLASQAVAEAEAEREAEREWRMLESLVARATPAWRDGRSEAPDVTPAIAAALARVRGAASRGDVGRYRELVGRMARVNGVIARAESGEPTGPVEGFRAAGDAPTSRFLGVQERGAVPSPDAGSREASLEAWKRLRAGLADEIVATASAITRQVRESS